MGTNKSSKKPFKNLLKNPFKNPFNNPFKNLFNNLFKNPFKNPPKNLFKIRSKNPFKKTTINEKNYNKTNYRYGLKIQRNLVQLNRILKKIMLNNTNEQIQLA